MVKKKPKRRNLELIPTAIRGVSGLAAIEGSEELKI
jgi:hypothetical protein